jgi:orotate phosphoribosyltransferase
MNNTSSKVAQYLLEIKAVKLEPSDPFTWSSGWYSPIYCDNRVTLSYPEIRNYLKTAFAAAVKEHFKDATALVGVATAGIALGALVADELNLPYAYCRPKPKEHGLKNQLEGRLAPGAKIVVVEDLISTGGSSIKVVEYLREEGYDVIGMGAIFTYGFKQAVENFKEANCDFFTLSNYSDLIKEALAIGYVQKAEIEELENWRKDPGNWRRDGFGF